jgi:hypothetical protein
VEKLSRKRRTSRIAFSIGSESKERAGNVWGLAYLRVIRTLPCVFCVKITPLQLATVSIRMPLMETAWVSLITRAVIYLIC